MMKTLQKAAEILAKKQWARIERSMPKPISKNVGFLFSWDAQTDITKKYMIKKALQTIQDVREALR